MRFKSEGRVDGRSGQQFHVGSEGPYQLCLRGVVQTCPQQSRRGGGKREESRVELRTERREEGGREGGERGSGRGGDGGVLVAGTKGQSLR